RRHLLDLATPHSAFRVAACTSAEMSEAERTGFFARVDLLAMNQDEAAALVGQPLDAEAPGPCLKEVAARLTAAQPDLRIIVTAGRAGAHGYERGTWHFAPALSVPVASTAGAGDALLGAVTAALAAGAGLAPALRFGTLVAGYAVTSPHTIHPDASLDAVLAFAARIGAAVPPEIESLC
ncbi:MAG: PfkB family carbohydrate kinase, partial [Gemmatimonadota bacterium]